MKLLIIPYKSRPNKRQWQRLLGYQKLKCKGFQDLKLKIAYDLNEPGNYQRGYAEIDKDYSIMEHFLQEILSNKYLQSTLL